MEDAYQRMREELTSELLDTIRSGSPEFFERLVLDPLVKMGYGGTRQDAGQAVGPLRRRRRPRLLSPETSPPSSRGRECRLQLGA